MSALLGLFEAGINIGGKPVWAALSLLQQVILSTTLLVLQYPGKKGDAYNILWALVFGFATLNILSLVARRFDPERTRMSFGEVLAIMVVIVSIFLLAWEFLTLLHIFPIQLQPR